MKRIVLLAAILLSVICITGCEYGMQEMMDELTTPPGSSVIYNANGADRGSAPDDVTEYREGSLVTVLDNSGNLERDNSYYFTGWNTSADGSGTTYTPGETFTIAKSDIMLYARWRQGTFYSVTYNTNGASGIAPVDNTWYESGTRVYVKGSGGLALTGYSFGGWSNGAETYTAGDSFVIASDTVLYAKWEQGATYRVTYHANGGTGGVPADETGYTPGAEVNVLANTGNMYMTGYRFGGWNTKSDGSGTNYAAGSTFIMGSADVDLYAKWDSYTYVVTFDSQGAGTNAYPEQVIVSTPNIYVAALPSVPVRTGYIFGGWWTLPNGGGTQFAGFTEVTGSITVYAKWTAGIYYIVFNKNDAGATGTMANQGIVYGASANLNACGFTKVNQYFAGWSTTPKGAVEYFDGAVITMNTLGLYLYAVWEYVSPKLDTTFGGNGIVTTAVGSSIDDGREVVIQSDGKIVVAGGSYIGSFENFAVVRYNSDGSLDKYFDEDPEKSASGTGDGIVTTAIGTSHAGGRSVVLQADGKIVVAGYSSNGSNNDIAVVRYNTNGTLDTSFGGDGIVTTAPSAGDDYGNSVVIQSDGKIVVTGGSVVVRYNIDGSLDTTFGSNGIVAIAIILSSVQSVTIQANGKIVVVGYTFFGGSNNETVVIRYNTDGSLDTSFGGDGHVTTASGYMGGNSVAVQPDGKIVVVGTSTNESNRWVISVTRYNTDGSLDITFGGDGVVDVAVSTENTLGFSVALQSDGKIVVAGYSINVSDYDFAVVRYNTDGSPDTSFGDDGFVIVDTGGGYGKSITIQPDGKIVVAGETFTSSGPDFCVIRLVP